MAKVLVLYVFHKLNRRVKLFMDKCVFKDENVDFMIISNDMNLKFPTPDYVKFFIRNNVGYDFGGWSEALLTNDLYKNYEYFIFVNSSVVGPFIPFYCKSKWTDIYIDGLKHDNVKLFGSTINTIMDFDKATVQSYIFSMDKTTLEYLIECEIFSMTNYAKTFQDTIDFKEILMSRKVVEKGWNIGSLLSYYKGVDFTNREKCKDVVMLGDLMYPQFIMNSVWDKHEVVFIKGNRFGIE